ncbi:MAG: hypothetical protein Q4F00_09640 [bacterium]|nr:hypothetical protein [bacterium]
MRKFLALCLAGMFLLGLSASVSGCGNAEANPCRWNLDKVALPSEVTEASRHSARNLVILDFYAEGEDKAQFSRDYELEPGQTEIIVDDVDVSGDTVYTIKGSLYCDDQCEPAVCFAVEETE